MSKKALVTGGGRGIGAAIARELAARSWNVTINYNSSEKEALALAAELGLSALRADIRDGAQVRGLFEATGGIDLLVNNAAAAAFGLFTDSEDCDRRDLFDVNVHGLMNCCRCAIPGMVRRKSGNIVNISSVWGLKGASCEAVYSATKSAVIGFTLSLAKELGPSGIRVNCVAPGVTETDMIAHLPEADKRALIGETPLGRLGSGADVAKLVAFLASEEASFITGQTVAVDGGFSL